MNKPLNYPPSKKWKGLTIFCYKCKTGVSDLCKQTGKPLNRCPFGERHAFKVIVHVPGTDNERKTKILQTRDVNEAIKQAMEIEKSVKENYSPDQTDYQLLGNSRPDSAPKLLSHVFARYIGFLHNEGVPTHRQKDRSRDHIKDVERALKLFSLSLKNNGININQTLITNLDDKMVGMIYERMENDLKFSARSINKYLSYLTSMVNWYIDEYDVPIKNWFEKARRKRIIQNPEAITKDVFIALLKKVTADNGVKNYEHGKKPRRNLFRPWLADGFRLALETGRRREEVINLRFNNIIEDRNGYSYIKTEDYKVNRIQKLTEHEKKYIYIPITRELRKLLDKLGYEKYKNTSNYILAPEITTTRTRVMADVLSKGFSHFYNLLNADKKLTFKSLRKAYITAIEIHTGNAKSVSGHSDNAVIEKHYIDREAVAKSLQGFNVFTEYSDRENDLRHARKRMKSRMGLEVQK